MFNGTMKLRLRDVVRRQERHAPTKDKRRRVNYVIAEYIGEDGHSYRKGFSSYDEPIVPTEGTHAELNQQSHQGVLRSQMGL